MIKIHFIDGDVVTIYYLPNSKERYFSIMEDFEFNAKSWITDKLVINPQLIKYIEWIDETDSDKDQ